MNDNELHIDRTCHVLYSKPCKKEIQKRIALHYPAEKTEKVWEQVQRKYAEFLSDWRTDLGGKKNFHNGAGGTYDCIAIMSYYAVCRDEVSLREIEEIEESLILPSFRRLKFVNCNKPFWKKLMYKAFTRAKAGCDKWHDYEMKVAPYDKNKPIYYEFTACPAAEFEKSTDWRRLCRRCAMWIMRPWSLSAQGSSAHPPALTAANAIILSAATATRI